MNRSIVSKHDCRGKTQDQIRELAGLLADIRSEVKDVIPYGDIDRKGRKDLAETFGLLTVALSKLGRF